MNVMALIGFIWMRKGRMANLQVPRNAVNYVIIREHAGISVGAVYSVNVGHKVLYCACSATITAVTVWELRVWSNSVVV